MYHIQKNTCMLVPVWNPIKATLSTHEIRPTDFYRGLRRAECFLTYTFVLPRAFPGIYYLVYMYISYLHAHAPARSNLNSYGGLNFIRSEKFITCLMGYQIRTRVFWVLNISQGIRYHVL